MSDDPSLLQSLGDLLKDMRVSQGISQEDVAGEAGVDPSVVGSIERGEDNPTIRTLDALLDGLGITWERFGNAFTDQLGGGASSVYEAHDVNLPHVSEEDGQAIEEFMTPLINDSSFKARDAIARSFDFALDRCPDENASDLWHHVIYRIYLEQKEGTNPEQSWVRTSGEAFEILLAQRYNPRLEDDAIRLRTLFAKSAREETLRRMGILDRVGSSKLDIVIEQRGAGVSVQDGYGIIGGVHAKASLAERVSDDIPASRIMMDEGFLSILMTLDVKSFPPPFGDWVNRGELGTEEDPSDKRTYIEDHGDFDACFSYNERTTPSSGETESGSRIFVGDLRAEEDEFVRFLRQRRR